MRTRLDELKKKRLGSYPGARPNEKWKQDTNLNHCTEKEKAGMRREGFTVAEAMAAGLDRGQIHHILYGYRFEGCEEKRE